MSPAEVGHVNAHATATSIGDLAEAKGIAAAVGTHPSVYAPKSALGHSAAAVGALEAILSALTLRDQVIPPTLNLANQDPDVELDVVHTKPRHTDVDFAQNNSFGFGGHNAAVLFGRYRVGSTADVFCHRQRTLRCLHLLIRTFPERAERSFG